MKKLIYQAIKYLKNIVAAIKNDIYFLYNKTYLLSEEEVDKKEINYTYKGKVYKVKLPLIEPQKEVKIRLKKIGPEGKDLILKLFYNKGAKQYVEHWVEKTALNKGYMGKINIENRVTDFIIDNSNLYSGIVLRNKGKLPFLLTILFRDRQYRGDVVVKLISYNSDILSGHSFFYNLTDQCLKEENKIFEKASAILRKKYDYINKVWQGQKNVHAVKVAEAYNHNGILGVFNLLKEYLRINDCVKLSVSNLINEPGRCSCKMITTTSRSNYSYIESKTQYFEDYEIIINQKYINNPFFVASILAHELCHIVYNKYFYTAEKFSGGFYRNSVWDSDASTCDMEQTVDILTFVLGLGEYRIRAKFYGVFFGYLQEPIFHNLFYFANHNVKEIFNN